MGSFYVENEIVWGQHYEIIFNKNKTKKKVQVGVLNSISQFYEWNWIVSGRIEFCV